MANAPTKYYVPAAISADSPLGEWIASRQSTQYDAMAAGRDLEQMFVAFKQLGEAWPFGSEADSATPDESQRGMED